MAENVFFKLRKAQLKVTPAKQVETPVSMVFNFGYYEMSSKGKKVYVPLTYPTGIKLKPCYWSGKPTYRAKQNKKVDYHVINTRLDNLEGMAKRVYRDLINQGVRLTPARVKEELDKLDGVIVDVSPDERPEDFNKFIDRFIKEIEEGRRLHQGKRYKEGTIKNFKGFQTQFNLFQEEKRKIYSFDQITIDFYDDFVLFFNKKKYSPNTIGRHVKNLKTIMRISRDEGLHDNHEIERKKFKILKVPVENVYLNESELKSLYDLDLSDDPTSETARDVFLIGCYTAQRFSDYSRISPANLQTLENGSKVIDLIQMKTGERVIIPIRYELDLLLKKYDYQVPKTYEQKVNERIKKVALKAGIKAPILVEAMRGGLKVTKEVPKNELVKTHTARRSGCTNMYLAGIPALDIMKISGHKTEREFLNYIKVTKEETAKNLANHPYFNQAPLKVVK